jgi:hypothetical protein
VSHSTTEIGKEREGKRYSVGFFILKLKVQLMNAIIIHRDEVEGEGEGK